METQSPQTTTEAETLISEEQYLITRRFCIDGLALSVPRFMERNQAVTLVTEWFPGDQLAVASLHKTIANNQRPAAA